MAERALRGVAVAAALGLSAFAAVSLWPLLRSASLAPMQIKRNAGTVTLVREGDMIPVRGTSSLKLGDLILTSRGASASLRLEGDREAELGASGRTVVVSTTTLESSGGKVLADAGDRMRVMFGDVEAESSSGVFRVDNGFAAARVGAYRGKVSLSATGQPTLDVPALFEAQVAGNDLAAGARPYRLRLRDAWDRTWLPDLIDLEIELGQLGDGLSAQLGRSRPSVHFFSSLAGGRAVGFVRPYLRRPVADLLIGFTIAKNARAPLAPSLRRSFRLYDEGARWAVVAGILRASSEQLLADLNEVVDRTGLVAGGTSAPDAFGDAGEGGEQGAPTGADGGAAGPPDQPDGGGAEEGGEKPEPEPEPSPSPTCDNPIDCTLEDVLPSPSPI